jgi:hypothetical protein
MRALALLFPLVFGSCANVVISQDEILKRSQAEIARREGWSDKAAILVEQRPGDYRFTWKVKAGAFDFSDYPSYRGIRFLPGTERELVFTKDGCLLGYHRHQSRCPGPYEPVVLEPSSLPVTEK